jgi:prolyl-tRNA editing enzyme YbaK/EbsC (Cys-tRNA(Pro) deacylase)
MSIYEEIINLLEANEISFKSVHHIETYTSEESAKARGEDISIGGKAILMKIEEEFVLLVISASRRIDTKKIKKFFKAKNTRFASVDELKELTGLLPGSVPPFGNPILPFKLYVDNSVLANDKIAFNAGSLTDSIIMNVNDYIRIADPVIFDFSRE